MCKIGEVHIADLGVAEIRLPEIHASEHGSTDENFPTLAGPHPANSPHANPLLRLLLRWNEAIRRVFE